MDNNYLNLLLLKHSKFLPEPEGGQEVEADEMQAKMKGLYRCKVVAAVLLILGVILSMVGCATSYQQSYLSAYQSPYGPGLIMQGLKIEHNVLNNKYLKVEKDDLEDDWSG